MGGPKTKTPAEPGLQENSGEEACSAIIGANEITRKRIASAKGQLALRGFAVHASTADGWFVVRWGLSHFCPRVSDLEAFARRVGGAAA